MEVSYGKSGPQYKATLFKSSQEKGAAILVIPAWRGKDRFAEEKAEALSQIGFTAMAIDLYGNGKVAKDNQEAESLMVPLFINRAELRDRLRQAYEKLISFPFVDKDRIGAIGFCFGGLATLELMRSNKNVRSAISVHGLFGGKIGPHQAKPESCHYGEGCNILLLHGAKDPLVPSEDVLAIQKELSQHLVSWEMDIYGQAMHAFTNPEAKETGMGLLYNKVAAQRAQRRINDFFEETLTLG